MKKIVLLFLLAAMVLALGACGGANSSSERTLIGAWNWEGTQAFVLNEDGTYSWLGVDYGALGSRWSSDNGTVSYTIGGITTEWFTYRFVNANTLRIEYAATPGVSHTLRRASGGQAQVAPGLEPSPAPADELEPELATTVSYEVVYSHAYAWVSSIGTAWVQSVFEVRNTGSVPLFLNSGAYDLERADGSLVASRSMVSVFPSIINPGESAFYYEEAMIDVDVGTELIILPRPNVREARVERVKFPVTDFSLTEGQFGGLRMLGRVENTSEETQTMVYVAVVLFDDMDNPIGLMFTILMEGLEPGDRIGFEQGSVALPDDVTLDRVARYEVFAYPLQFQF